MKKYIILCNSAEIGGAETMCVIIANKLISKKLAKVYFICYEDGEIFKRLDPKIKIKKLLGRKTFQKAYSLYKLIKNIDGDLIIISAVTGLNFIAALNIVNYMFFRIFKIYKCNKISLYSWEVNKLYNRKLTKLKYIFNIVKLNIISIFSKKIICISTDIFDEFKKLLILKKNLQKIGCPVFDSGVNAQKEKKISEIKENYIIAISRHHPQKDLLLLVDIYHNLLKFGFSYNLHIYGEYSKTYTSLLQKKIKYLGLERKIILFKPVPNIIGAIRGSKFMIHTAAWEGLGNSLIESIYHGNPVVALDCPGGIKDYLKSGKNGILIKSRSAEFIAKTIIDKKILLNKLKSSNMKNTIIKYEADFVLDQLFNEV